MRNFVEVAEAWLADVARQRRPGLYSATSQLRCPARPPAWMSSSKWLPAGRGPAAPSTRREEGCHSGQRVTLAA